MKRKDTAWAIASGRRLYTGTAPTKRAAIACHVWAYDKGLYEAGYPHCQSHPLSERQNQVWAERQKRGDVAVKVKIEEADQ